MLKIAADGELIEANSEARAIFAMQSGELPPLFERFNQVGVTVLIASHDLALISRMQYRILNLRQGRLIAQPGGE